MKKYIIYLGILAIGIVLGSLAFGDTLTQNDENNHEISEIKTNYGPVQCIHKLNSQNLVTAQFVVWI